MRFRLTIDNCRSSARPKDLARGLLCKTSDKAGFAVGRARVAKQARSEVAEP
ncbi:hypothetical protein LEP1GSC058_0847 [Leptospira fainei serovar Hurstbridge str. BUT 6]|uniref:Uncharacterized protein n=1 Tax=Leptospira fainei serovar Hurstbridge str. BUT 6 TaxID=1193011 RepID=S3VX03_9LEPT|nr:hypothetical protein LEP1GSC058_0847 [Leptospira fainei serovar Hurstbridge str. BUT 6]